MGFLKAGALLNLYLIQDLAQDTGKAFHQYLLEELDSPGCLKNILLLLFPSKSQKTFEISAGPVGLYEKSFINTGSCKLEALSEDIRTIFIYLNCQKPAVTSLSASYTTTYFHFRIFIISKGRHKERNKNASFNEGCELVLNR